MRLTKLGCIEERKGEFKSDLKDGEAAQEYFKEFLQKTINYKSCTKSNKEQQQDFDLEIKFKHSIVTTENKADFYSGTNRDKYNDSFFVEIGKGEIKFECDEIRKRTFKIASKGSGLTTTKADYWVQYFISTDEFWIIPTKELRTLVDSEINRLIDNKQEYCMRTKSKNNNGEYYIGYIIPKSRMRHHFYIFKVDDWNNIYSILRLKTLFNE